MKKAQFFLVLIKCLQLFLLELKTYSKSITFQYLPKHSRIMEVELRSYFKTFSAVEFVHR